jgi:hypothetical protein
MRPMISCSSRARALIGAELGAQLGITDLDGSAPLSLRYRMAGHRNSTRAFGDAAERPLASAASSPDSSGNSRMATLPQRSASLPQPVTSQRDVSTALRVLGR